jgi:hypothetical protein
MHANPDKFADTYFRTKGIVVCCSFSVACFLQWVLFFSFFEKLITAGRLWAGDYDDALVWLYFWREMMLWSWIRWWMLSVPKLVLPVIRIVSFLDKIWLGFGLISQLSFLYKTDSFVIWPLLQDVKGKEEPQRHQEWSRFLFIPSQGRYGWEWKQKQRQLSSLVARCVLKYNFVRVTDLSLSISVFS